MKVESIGFSSAIQVQTKFLPDYPYDIQLIANNDISLTNGDMLTFSFYVRCVSSGTGMVEFVVEEREKPYKKILRYFTNPGKEWAKSKILIAIPESYDPGDIRFCFRLGAKIQTIEIGGVEFINYGKVLPDEILVNHFYSYDVSDQNTEWRELAQNRIDSVRKTDFSVLVKDMNSRPIEKATVIIEMTRHKFRFGTAVSSHYITNDITKDAVIYRQKVKELFDYVVFESDLKWKEWENIQRRKNTLKAVQWLNENNIEIRGHCLVWPWWKKVPTDIRKNKNDPSYIRDKVKDHIVDIVTELNGIVQEWDVINEPVTHHELTDITGEGSVSEWFEMVKHINPNIDTYVNDYGILNHGGVDIIHQQKSYKYIDRLLQEGVRLDGIGIQSHFNWQLTPIQNVLDILGTFSKFHKKILITEFDVNVFDEILQADYVRDFMTACFSHPSVDGIYMWGFWDGRHYRNNAPVYRKDWSMKPSGKVWYDLVYNKWWTNDTGTTNDKGVYSTRGFLGTYYIKVIKDGKTVIREVELNSGGLILEIVVE
ncbi:MAG: endo-1,4-beta-xylanase [Actinobacteria bacterium]|nr:endo-1,4-beta-xylanase [Actinomycetota bacterium]